MVNMRGLKNGNNTYQHSGLVRSHDFCFAVAADEGFPYLLERRCLVFLDNGE